MSEPSALAKALAAFQKELPNIGKNESANTGQYKYEYASLDIVAGKVLPLLGKHGLAFTCITNVLDGKFHLDYTLLHESGESRTGRFPIPLAGNPQQIGSWLTYARRYALLCVTGVHPGGEDDDAAAALGLNNAPAPTPTGFHHATGGNQDAPSTAPRQATKPETGQETGQINEKAQVLASLAHELSRQNCTVAELKAKVYDLAKAESLLNGLVINPFDASLGQLSAVITMARKEAEARTQVQAELGGEQ